MAAKNLVETDQRDPRMKAVKRILVSQPEPNSEDSPYYKLAQKHDLQVDFMPFIEVEPVPSKEFRKEKINFLDYSAVIFTSRNAVDHYFRIAQDMKWDIPPEMKYFCVSEQTANYLQKYIVIRKRKIFVGGRSASDLLEVLKKHKKETYLYPCSNIRKDDIPNFLKENNYTYQEAVLYRTVSSDLSRLKNVDYDLIAFFSPSGIKSLLENFPNFQQHGTRVAAFGPSTAQAVEEAGLILDIQAPHPDQPSMTGAIDDYIKQIERIK